jgi:hypothetical protein
LSPPEVFAPGTGLRRMVHCGWMPMIAVPGMKKGPSEPLNPNSPACFLHFLESDHEINGAQ